MALGVELNIVLLICLVWMFKLTIVENAKKVTSFVKGRIEVGLNLSLAVFSEVCREQTRLRLRFAPGKMRHL